MEMILTLWLLGFSAPLAYLFSLCCCGVTCDVCQNAIPEQFQIDISGMLDGGTCTNCSVFDGTWVVTHETALAACGAAAQECIWRSGQASPHSNCSAGCGIMVYMVVIGSGPVTYALRVLAQTCTIQLGGCTVASASTFEKSDSSRLDCDNFSSESFPFVANLGGGCDGSSATCLVTKL